MFLATPIEGHRGGGLDLAHHERWSEQKLERVTLICFVSACRTTFLENTGNQLIDDYTGKVCPLASLKSKRPSIHDIQRLPTQRMFGSNNKDDDARW